MSAYSSWLHVLAWAYLSLCFGCALIISVDEFRRPQNMMIMNFVWPITALYLGPAAAWSYFKSGMKMTKQHHQKVQQAVQEELRRERRGKAIQENSSEEGSPSREQVAVATTHCGAGCTLGDISAEWLVFAMGLTFAGGEFSTRLVMDFLLAWSYGIVFQYLTIVPMRGLPFGKGALHAMRADTLSIVSFQAGLFAWMALTYYVLFPNPHLKPTEAVFWFMMQVGMVFGFFTSYPANIFLINKGWKEKMPQYKSEMKQKMLEEPEESERAA